MKTRAAVAFEAKKPLEIVELDLEGPKAGEVLVEVKATGIWHCIVAATQLIAGPQLVSAQDVPGGGAS